MIQVLIISSLYSQTQHLRRILLGQAGHIQLCGTADNSVLGMSLIESLHPDVVIMPVHMTFWNPEDLINYLLPRGICPRFVLLSDGSEAVIEGAAAVKVQQLLPDAMPSDAMLLHAVEEAGRLQKHETGAVRPPENEYVQHSLEVMELLMGLVPVGTGSAQQHLPETLFYEELSKQAGVEIADDEALMQMLRELSQTKKLYEKVQTALEQVKATGYGIVMPGAEELKLEKPEIVKKNGNYAVKLRASAPSIHMMRAQIETEISPMVGGEQESQQLIDYLLGEYEEDTDKLWQSNIFGKSLYELVSEGVTAKIMRMPDDARQKLTKTLGRMINENTGGMICILL